MSPAPNSGFRPSRTWSQATRRSRRLGGPSGIAGVAGVSSSGRSGDPLSTGGRRGLGTRLGGRGVGRPLPQIVRVIAAGGGGDAGRRVRALVEEAEQGGGGEETIG